MDRAVQKQVDDDFRRKNLIRKLKKTKTKTLYKTILYSTVNRHDLVS